MAKRKTSDKPSEGEIDGPSVIAHPRASHALFGHEAQEDLFLRSYLSGSLHHAWLLTGDKGIGKATFAYRAARFLLTRDPIAPETDAAPTLDVSPETPAARQIANGAHPSLFVLSADETGSAASIGVEAVRKLRSFLGLTSPGGWRVLIVDPTNDLTVSSANALLKAVEEPPARTIFFLVSHGAASVMPTIRSRCVKLSFRSLSEPDFTSAVSAACALVDRDEPAENDLATAYRLASGSPGTGLELLTGGLMPVLHKVQRIVSGLPKMDYALVHELIQSAAGARNAATFSRLCDVVEERIEDIARQAATDRSQSARSAAPWAEFWRSARERRLELEALNLDKGAFLLSLFSDMEKVARDTFSRI
jgi:DNA polymerase-3 subunit delta'